MNRARNIYRHFIVRESTLHCRLTTLLTMLGVVVDKVSGLLMLQFGYVECLGIRGLTLKGHVVETWRGIFDDVILLSLIRNVFTLRGNQLNILTLITIFLNVRPILFLVLCTIWLSIDRKSRSRALSRHEKSSPLLRVKCVVKGTIKATFPSFWWFLTRIKHHRWMHLCHPDQRR